MEISAQYASTSNMMKMPEITIAQMSDPSGTSATPVNA